VGGAVFGRCATGDAGIGAMAPPEAIIQAVEQALGFEKPKGTDK
jgi:hypothetical protein